MTTICSAGRGTKCTHKLNTQTPEGIKAISCGLLATPEQCSFAQIVSKWEKKPENFALTEKEVVV